MKKSTNFVRWLICLILTMTSCTEERSLEKESTLSVTRDLVFVETGESASITIKGTGRYNIEIGNPELLQYSLDDGGNLIITGEKDGRTQIFISDESGLTIPLEIIIGNKGSREQDSLALIDIYTSTNPDNWVEKWQIQYPIEYWKGVKLNKQGRVVSLDLKANGLKGRFPRAVSKLFFLERLDLSMNEFTDEIPVEICSLINLHYLKLNYMNGLEMDPQTIQELSRLSQLDTLGFIDVNVRGKIPPTLGKLQNLISLDFGFFNQDKFPLEICNLKNLKSLSMYNGNFGTIPYEISQLNNLEELRLADDGLRGKIPEEVSRLPNLKILNLSRNQLEGDFPASFTQLKKLKGLYLSNNHITSIPHDFSKMDSLEFVSFRHNDIRGTVPEFGDLIHLRHIDFSHNMLTGNISTNLNRLNALNTLLLNDNSLDGDIPETLSDIKNIEHIELQNNNITGNVPENFADKNPGRPLWLDFRNNRLTGELPEKIRACTDYLEGRWLFMPQQEGYGFSIWVPIEGDIPEQN